MLARMTLNLDEELGKYRTALDEVRAQLGPLQEEEAKLVKIIGALEGASKPPAAPRKGASRRKTPSAAQKRAKKAPSGSDLTQALLEALRAEEGRSARAVGLSIGTSAQTARLHFAKLEEEGKVRREGKGTNTRYYIA